MELSNAVATSRQGRALSETGQSPTDVTTYLRPELLRKPSSRTKFSHPGLSRHGSRESRSSNGSVPGMTDTSDSDLSFDDDGIYNTSAGELWDSFWPTSTAASTRRQSHEHQLTLLPAGQQEDCLKVSPARYPHRSNEAGNATAVTLQEHDPKAATCNSLHHISQSPPTQPLPKKNAVTYSVRSKPPVTSIQRHPHPPRTSSLGFEPLCAAQQPLHQRGSRSRTNSKPNKPSHNTNSFIIPLTTTSYGNMAVLPQRLPLDTTKTAASVPVSPENPLPPPPKNIRPGTSEFSVRDQTQAYNNKSSASHHNVTRPPQTSLLPSPLPNVPPTQLHAEQFVSVFELDSDSETEADGADRRKSLAKRIARGLHRKSASEKRCVAERKAVTPASRTSDADAPEKDAAKTWPRRSRSPSRKRGGSLGRIFWLMAR